MPPHPMQWSLPLLRLGGLPIRLHWTLLVVGLSVTLRAAAAGHLRFTICYEGLILVSILLHELGHCWAARRVGGEAQEIILWPLGGLALVQAPRQPRPQILVAIMGPAMNAVLFLLVAPVLWALGHNPFDPDSAAGFTTFVLSLFCWAQIFLIGFNLIPAFPLDGSQVLRWSLAGRYGLGAATQLVLRIGYVFAALILVWGLASDSLLLCGLALFSFVACRQEQMAFQEMDLVLGTYDFSQGYQSLEPSEPRPGFFARWRAERRRRREERQAASAQELRAEVDRLLEKVSREGMHTLTPGERSFLQRASESYRRRPD